MATNTQRADENENNSIMVVFNQGVLVSLCYLMVSLFKYSGMTWMDIHESDIDIDYMHPGEVYLIRV